MTIILDKVAAAGAQQIVKAAQKFSNLETVITKALGVLEEQGVYALMLFLLSRKGEEAKVANHIRDQLIKLLAEVTGLKSLSGLEKLQAKSDSPSAVLEFYLEQITADLDRLFLVRDLYELTLTYARYGAKAVSKSKTIPEQPETQPDADPAAPA